MTKEKGRKKRIAYISSPDLADCDIPLLQEMAKEAEVVYILEVIDKSRRKTIIDIDKLKGRGDLFPFSDYPGLKALESFIDTRKAYVLNMPGHHGFSPANLLAVYRMVRFLRKGNFDLIHITWPPRYGEFLIYVLWRKLILSVHDPLPHSSEDGKLNRFHRKICFSILRNFVLLNKAQETQFIDTYNLQGKNIFISMLGVYTHLRTTRRDPIDKSGYVLFFGSIKSHKGVEYLCEAMKTVHEKLRDSRLIIAGKGDMYFDIQPYVRGGYVELLNHYISDNLLAALIANALFVVCPYVDATQSGVIMSAFALNVPVIATDVGGLPEMVEHGRHGLIVPPRDSNALASAMCSLIDNPKLLSDMRENICHDFSRGARSWRSIAKGMLDIYDSISSKTKHKT